LAIELVIPETILRRLNRLPTEVRLKFWEQIEKLMANPSHPSLRNERLTGTTQWVFSITMSYRATYLRDKANLIVTAIGTHKEVLGK
jgi:hypothetical protein